MGRTLKITVKESLETLKAPYKKELNSKLKLRARFGLQTHIGSCLAAIPTYSPEINPSERIWKYIK